MSAKKTNKDKKGSFIIQASVLAAASLIVRFIGFLYRLPLTALIGDRGNAIYSAGYYIYTFLLILSSAGLPAAISRLVSTRIAKGEYRNAQKIFRVSMIFAGAAGAIGMLVLFFFAEPIAKMVDSPNSVYCLQTLAPTLLIVGVMSVYRGYLQGMNIMTPTAVSQIFEQVFNAVFSVYLAWVLVKQSIPLGAAGGTAGTGIGALAGLIVVMIFYNRMKPEIRHNMRIEEMEVENKKLEDELKDASGFALGRKKTIRDTIEYNMSFINKYRDVGQNLEAERQQVADEWNRKLHDLVGDTDKLKHEITENLGKMKQLEQSVAAEKQNLLQKEAELSKM